MEIGERLEVGSREGWRTWLAEHHEDKQEIWLVLYKSRSPKRALTLEEAQEEAVAFGWVESNLKPIDVTCYALRPKNGLTPVRGPERYASSRVAITEVVYPDNSGYWICFSEAHL